MWDTPTFYKIYFCTNVSLWKQNCYHYSVVCFYFLTFLGGET
jgi:hypothetical protein